MNVALRFTGLVNAWVCGAESIRHDWFGASISGAVSLIILVCSSVGEQG